MIIRINAFINLFIKFLIYKSGEIKRLLTSCKRAIINYYCEELIMDNKSFKSCIIAYSATINFHNKIEANIIIRPKEKSRL